MLGFFEFYGPVGSAFLVAVVTLWFYGRYFSHKQYDWPFVVAAMVSTLCTWYVCFQALVALGLWVNDLNNGMLFYFKSTQVTMYALAVLLSASSTGILHMYALVVSWNYVRGK